MKKNITLSCMIFLVILYVRANIFLLPNCTVLDSLFWFTPKEAYELLGVIKKTSFRYYLEILIWDSFLPAVYAYLVISISSHLIKSVKYLILFPLLAMSFDYLENVFNFVLIFKYPEPLFNFYSVSNIIGTVKYLLQYCSWILLLTGLITRILKKYHSYIKK